MRACVPVSLVLVLAFALGAAGCTARAADVPHVATDEELANASDTATGGWQSAPWSCAWLPFPGRSAVVIPHRLGRTPDSVLVYLSFVGNDHKKGCDEGNKRTSVDEGNERTSFIGAGDTAHIYAITDPDARGVATITVENTTNADFYLRVVLQ